MVWAGVAIAPTTRDAHSVTPVSSVNEPESLTHNNLGVDRIVVLVCGFRSEQNIAMLKRGLATFAVLIFAANLEAATWDEPFHRDVVAKADAFGLYEVVQGSGSGVVMKEVRHLAGTETGATVQVNGFYAGELLSSSSINGVATAESAVRLKGAGTRYYLFLKKAPSGSAWRIATQTSGYAEVLSDGKVGATFRISIHQALLDSAVYELTQTCIFRKLHGQDCSPDVYEFIQTQLAAAPGSLAQDAKPDQVDRFFTQHAALETAYLTGYSVDLGTLSKFLDDQLFHTQISAVSAPRPTAAPGRNARLIAFVSDDSRNLLARVFAVQMLREVEARELKDQITAYIPKAPATRVGLGFEIMDPRIGTFFPDSLKGALEGLLAEWK